jgi:hypothetical protein
MRKIPKGLLLLAHQLVAIKKKAKKLGLFTDDRDLLTCQRCGLMEDVAAFGRLIACWTVGAKDTGLRFKPIGRTPRFFRCPACASQVKVHWW